MALVHQSGHLEGLSIVVELGARRITDLAASKPQHVRQDDLVQAGGLGRRWCWQDSPDNSGNHAPPGLIR